MIEDEDADFQLVARFIRKSSLNAEITRVQDIDELKDAIVKGGWDVVLSDYKVVGLDFRESLDIIINNLVGIPVIMVSGSVGEETAVDLLKRGLCDFVLKDRLQRLVPAIERSLKDRLEKRRREKVEDALKESESRFRTYVESSPMGIIVADENGRFIDVNHTVEHLLGYDRETLLTLGVDAIAPPEDLDEVREDYERMMATGQLEGEYRMTTKDGSIIWTALKGVRIGQDRYMAYFQDITSRKDAERSRVFNTRLLELVHEHVDMQMLIKEFVREIKGFTECDAVGIRVLDHEGNIPYQAYDGFSQGFFEVESPLSIKSDKCMCINVIKGATDDRLPFYTKFGSFYMNGTSQFLSTVSEEEKGETRNVCNAVGFESVALVPFRSEGKILGLIHVADRRENKVPLYLVEILERAVMQLGTAFQQSHARKDLKIQQEKFRNLSQEYRILLDNVPDGIVYLSPDCRIRWANAAANSFFGLSSEADSHGKTCHEAFWNRDESCPDCPVVRSIQTGRNEIGELSAEQDDRKYEVRAVPMKDEKGVVYGVIEIIRDITEHRKLEEQLRQAQKMESIGALAGGIAHDFNNILSAVLGYGELVLDSMDENAPQRDGMNAIIEAGLRAAHLTKDLLLFSRKQVSDKGPVEINSVISKIEKFIRRIIGEDIQCGTHLYRKPIMIHADGHQIEQVLMNLATNARDAMPKGGVFTISTTCIELDGDFVDAHGFGKPGAYALVTVSDTGKGMDKKIREKIFEPFFTTKELGKGTGLGLAVVYGIVNDHQGYVHVYSEPDKGTVFRIYLPMIREAGRVELEQAEWVMPEGGNEVILLAEDEVSVRKLFTTILKRSGYSVIEAVDGEDAIRKFEENKDTIDLLLFDLVMPKLDGKKALESIRRVKDDMKGIFVSGYAPEHIRQKDLFDLHMEVLFKPVSPRELLRVIRKILDHP